MSKCISRHGEYSDHELPGYEAYTCARCWVFDGDAALAEIARLRAENERLTEELSGAHLAITQNEQLRAELAAVDRRQQLPHPVKARLWHLRSVNADLVLRVQSLDERLVGERARAEEAFRRATRAEAEIERLRSMDCTERCGCTCTDCDESDG